MVTHKKALRQAGLPTQGSRGECLQRIAVAKTSNGVQKKSASKQSRSKQRIVKVKFQVGNDPTHGPSPYVGLTIEGQKASLKEMANKDEIVLMEGEGKDINVVFDYPLQRPAEFVLTAPLTRKDLVRFIGAAYRLIYDQESASSSLRAEPMCERIPGCALVNRANTDGIHGIYGHDLGDLALHTVTYDIEAGKIYLGVDS
tara:strand:- start:12 stop:611 length:600 start_codon:yes stop_codon:yes gene_type:complete